MTIEKSISIKVNTTPSESITFIGSSTEGLEVCVHGSTNTGNDDSATISLCFKTKESYLELKRAFLEAGLATCLEEFRQDE